MEMNENIKKAELAAKAGFTLVEIIIAIAIVGIMAAVAVPNINKNIKRARISAARQLISTAAQATTTYSLDHSGKTPASQDAWIEALTGGDDPEIEGGADALNDPWGEPLKYEKVGKGSRFKITSAGPDGEFGTDDDLTNIDDKKNR
jgi:general secretion pathway protein G